MAKKAARHVTERAAVAKTSRAAYYILHCQDAAKLPKKNLIGENSYRLIERRRTNR